MSCQKITRHCYLCSFQEFEELGRRASVPSKNDGRRRVEELMEVPPGTARPVRLHHRELRHAQGCAGERSRGLEEREVRPVRVQELLMSAC